METAWDDSVVFPCGAVRDAETINVNEHEVIELFCAKSSIHNHPCQTTHPCTHTYIYNTAQEHKNGQKWSKHGYGMDDLLLKRALLTDHQHKIAKVSLSSGLNQYVQDLRSLYPHHASKVWCCVAVYHIKPVMGI